MFKLRQLFSRNPDLEIIASLSDWHKPGRRVWSKIISLLVTVTFIFPYLTWAFETKSFSQSGKPIMFNNQPLRISSKLGTITQFFQGRDQLVVHIQDLHCNYEVQNNVAKIIDSLAKQHGLRLITVEGASLPINVAKLSTFPLEEVKRQTADYLMKQGKITGPEMYAATGRHSIRLEGIESPELYEENWISVMKFLNNESQGYIFDLRETLDELKSGIYNSKLARLDEKKQAFRKGDISLLKYSVYLYAYGARHKLNLKTYPNLSAYVSRRKHIFSEAVDSDRLFKELDLLDRALRAGLYTDSDQEEMDLLQRRLDIMEKLVNISAAPEELAEYRANPEDFQGKRFLDYMAQHDKLGRFRLDAKVYKLDRYLGEVKEFYRVADERSLAFVENTLSCMSRHNTKIAIQVTGGYHTPEVLAGLEARGVSYICVKPQLRRRDIVNPYFTLLRNRRTPLEKLLAQNQNILGLRSFFQPKNAGDALLTGRLLDLLKLAISFPTILEKSKTKNLEALITGFKEISEQCKQWGYPLCLVPDFKTAKLNDNTGAMVVAVNGIRKIFQGLTLIIQPKNTSEEVMKSQKILNVGDFRVTVTAQKLKEEQIDQIVKDQGVVIRAGMMHFLLNSPMAPMGALVGLGSAAIVMPGLRLRLMGRINWLADLPATLGSGFGRSLPGALKRVQKGFAFLAEQPILIRAGLIVAVVAAVALVGGHFISAFPYPLAYFSGQTVGGIPAGLNAGWMIAGIPSLRKLSPAQWAICAGQASKLLDDPALLVSVQAWATLNAIKKNLPEQERERIEKLLVERVDRQPGILIDRYRELQHDISGYIRGLNTYLAWFIEETEKSRETENISISTTIKELLKIHKKCVEADKQLNDLVKICEREKSGPANELKDENANKLINSFVEFQAAYQAVTIKYQDLFNQLVVLKKYDNPELEKCRKWICNAFPEWLLAEEILNLDNSPRHIDLRIMCASAGNMIEEKYGQFKELSIKTPPGFADQAIWLEGKYGLILYSVIKNAIKNSLRALREQQEKQGKKYTPEVTVEFTENGNIVVTDNGIGMDNNIIESVIFKRGSSTKSGSDVPAGLGGHIMERTIRGFGGEIKVESEKGVGTTMTFIFKNASGKAADYPLHAQLIDVLEKLGSLPTSAPSNKNVKFSFPGGLGGLGYELLVLLGGKFDKEVEDLLIGLCLEDSHKFNSIMQAALKNPPEEIKQRKAEFEARIKWVRNFVVYFTELDKGIVLKVINKIMTLQEWSGNLIEKKLHAESAEGYTQALKIIRKLEEQGVIKTGKAGNISGRMGPAQINWSKLRDYYEAGTNPGRILKDIRDHPGSKVLDIKTSPAVNIAKSSVLSKWIKELVSNGLVVNRGNKTYAELYLEPYKHRFSKDGEINKNKVSKLLCAYPEEDKNRIFRIYYKERNKFIRYSREIRKELEEAGDEATLKILAANLEWVEEKYREIRDIKKYFQKYHENNKEHKLWEVIQRLLTDSIRGSNIKDIADRSGMDGKDVSNILKELEKYKVIEILTSHRNKTIQNINLWRLGEYFRTGTLAGKVFDRVKNNPDFKKNLIETAAKDMEEHPLDILEQIDKLVQAGLIREQAGFNGVLVYAAHYDKQKLNELIKSRPGPESKARKSEDEILNEIINMFHLTSSHEGEILKYISKGKTIREIIVETGWNERSIARGNETLLRGLVRIKGKKYELAEFIQALLHNKPPGASGIKQNLSVRGLLSAFGITIGSGIIAFLFVNIWLAGIFLWPGAIFGLLIWFAWRVKGEGNIDGEKMERKMDDQVKIRELETIYKNKYKDMEFAATSQIIEKGGRGIEVVVDGKLILNSAFILKSESALFNRLKRLLLPLVLAHIDWHLKDIPQNISARFEQFPRLRYYLNRLTKLILDEAPAYGIMPLKSLWLFRPPFYKGYAAGEDILSKKEVLDPQCFAFTLKELELTREITKWLEKMQVNRIFDVHSHLYDMNQLEDKGMDITKARTWVSEGTTLSCPPEFLRWMHKMILGKIPVKTVVFGLPSDSYNIEKMNNSLINKTKEHKFKNKFIPFAVTKPGFSKEKLENLVSQGFRGFKPHYKLVKLSEEKSPEDITLNDYLTEPMLQVADKFNLPITVHLHSNKKEVYEKIQEFAKKYNNAIIILAHFGECREVESIAIAANMIKDYKNIYFDTSGLASSKVFRKAVEILGSQRLLYGMDMPFAAIAGKWIEQNGMRVLSARTPYRFSARPKWEEILKAVSESDKKEYVKFALSELVKIKAASDTLIAKGEMQPQDLQDIFYNNAAKVLKIKPFANKVISWLRGKFVNPRFIWKKVLELFLPVTSFFMIIWGLYRFIAHGDAAYIAPVFLTTMGLAKTIKSAPIKKPTNNEFPLEVSIEDLMKCTGVYIKLTNEFREELFYENDKLRSKIHGGLAAIMEPEISHTNISRYKSGQIGIPLAGLIRLLSKAGYTLNDLEGTKWIDEMVFNTIKVKKPSLPYNLNWLDIAKLSGFIAAAFNVDNQGRIRLTNINRFNRYRKLLKAAFNIEIPRAWDLKTALDIDPIAKIILYAAETISTGNINDIPATYKKLNPVIQAAYWLEYLNNLPRDAKAINAKYIIRYLLQSKGYIKYRNNQWDLTDKFSNNNKEFWKTVESLPDIKKEFNDIFHFPPQASDINTASKARSFMFNEVKVFLAIVELMKKEGIKNNVFRRNQIDELVTPMVTGEILKILGRFKKAGLIEIPANQSYKLTEKFMAMYNTYKKLNWDTRKVLEQFINPPQTQPEEASREKKRAKEEIKKASEFINECIDKGVDESSKEIEYALELLQAAYAWYEKGLYDKAFDKAKKAINTANEVYTNVIYKDFMAEDNAGPAMEAGDHLPEIVEDIKLELHLSGNTSEEIASGLEAIIKFIKDKLAGKEEAEIKEWMLAAGIKSGERIIFNRMRSISGIKFIRWDFTYEEIEAYRKIEKTTGSLSQEGKEKVIKEFIEYKEKNRKSTVKKKAFSSGSLKFTYEQIENYLEFTSKTKELSREEIKKILENIDYYNRKSESDEYKGFWMVYSCKVTSKVLEKLEKKLMTLKKYYPNKGKEKTRILPYSKWLNINLVVSLVMLLSFFITSHASALAPKPEAPIMPQKAEMRKAPQSSEAWYKPNKPILFFLPPIFEYFPGMHRAWLLVMAIGLGVCAGGAPKINITSAEEAEISELMKISVIPRFAFEINNTGRVFFSVLNRKTSGWPAWIKGQILGHYIVSENGDTTYCLPSYLLAVLIQDKKAETGSIAGIRYKMALSLAGHIVAYQNLRQRHKILAKDLKEAQNEIVKTDANAWKRIIPGIDRAMTVPVLEKGVGLFSITLAIWGLALGALAAVALSLPLALFALPAGLTAGVGAWIYANRISDIRLAYGNWLKPDKREAYLLKRFRKAMPGNQSSLAKILSDEKSNLRKIMRSKDITSIRQFQKQMLKAFIQELRKCDNDSALLEDAISCMNQLAPASLVIGGTINSRVFRLPKILRATDMQKEYGWMLEYLYDFPEVIIHKEMKLIEQRRNRRFIWQAA